MAEPLTPVATGNSRNTEDGFAPADENRTESLESAHNCPLAICHVVTLSDDEGWVLVTYSTRPSSDVIDGIKLPHVTGINLSETYEEAAERAAECSTHLDIKFVNVKEFNNPNIPMSWLGSYRCSFFFAATAEKPDEDVEAKTRPVLTGQRGEKLEWIHVHELKYGGEKDGIKVLWMEWEDAIRLVDSVGAREAIIERLQYS